MNELTILKPTDCHIHLRDELALGQTVADAAKQFSRAIVMPNLQPPVIDMESLNAYQHRIQAHIPAQRHFQPLMTLYLHESQHPDMLIAAKNAGVIGVKLYPKGATTNAEHGVKTIEQFYPLFETMAAIELPLLIHGEITDSHVDIFDREALFIERVLAHLIQDFPSLKIVLEHITTNEAVAFVKAQSNHVAATITAHHLLLNRNDLLVGGIRPHHYCLPILKRNTHQQALQQAAISGDPHFFLGTDSAPHLVINKQSACGCAGIYTAHAAIELYAQVFEQLGALDKLEQFASVYGPDFYGLAPTLEKITLVKQPWTVPHTLPYDDNNKIVPLFAGDTLEWSLNTHI